MRQSYQLPGEAVKPNKETLPTFIMFAGYRTGSDKSDASFDEGLDQYILLTGECKAKNIQEVPCQTYRYMKISLRGALCQTNRNTSHSLHKG